MNKLLIILTAVLALQAQAAPPASHVQSVVVIPAIKKPKLFRSNPFRFVAIRFADVNPLDAPDDEFLAADRRRQYQVDQDQELDIGDDIKLKLALARERAIRCYREKWV